MVIPINRILIRRMAEAEEAARPTNPQYSPYSSSPSSSSPSPHSGVRTSLGSPLTVSISIPPTPSANAPIATPQTIRPVTQSLTLPAPSPSSSPPPSDSFSSVDSDLRRAFVRLMGEKHESDLLNERLMAQQQRAPMPVPGTPGLLNELNRQLTEDLTELEADLIEKNKAYKALQRELWDKVQENSALQMNLDQLRQAEAVWRRQEKLLLAESHGLSEELEALEGELQEREKEIEEMKIQMKQTEVAAKAAIAAAATAATASAAATPTSSGKSSSSFSSSVDRPLHERRDEPAASADRAARLQEELFVREDQIKALQYTIDTMKHSQKGALQKAKDALAKEKAAHEKAKKEKAAIEEAARAGEQQLRDAQAMMEERKQIQVEFEQKQMELEAYESERVKMRRDNERLAREAAWARDGAEAAMKEIEKLKRELEIFRSGTLSTLGVSSSDGSAPGLLELGARCSELEAQLKVRKLWQADSDQKNFNLERELTQLKQFAGELEQSLTRELAAGRILAEQLFAMEEARDGERETMENKVKQLEETIVMMSHRKHDNNNSNSNGNGGDHNNEEFKDDGDGGVGRFSPTAFDAAPLTSGERSDLLAQIQGLTAILASQIDTVNSLEAKLAEAEDIVHKQRAEVAAANRERDQAIEQMKQLVNGGGERGGRAANNAGSGLLSNEEIFALKKQQQQQSSSKPSKRDQAASSAAESALQEFISVAAALSPPRGPSPAPSSGPHSRLASPEPPPTAKSPPSGVPRVRPAAAKSPPPPRAAASPTRAATQTTTERRKQTNRSQTQQDTSSGNSNSTSSTESSGAVFDADSLLSPHSARPGPPAKSRAASTGSPSSLGPAAAALGGRSRIPAAPTARK